MAANALEEKINKIRQQNEEIRRRHEEVEADKKNAAKSNALVQMVPSADWPERKEPPEFSNPPARSSQKQKLSNREPNEHPPQQQHHVGSGDGKKVHVFAEGDGPPPDPKYNFLADSEREEYVAEDSRESESGRGRNKVSRGGPKRRGGGREGHSKDYRAHQAGPKDPTLPDYAAWRAERNRIDEARISRQRTAEGNWRREWDNNKVNVDNDERAKDSRVITGDTARKDIEKKRYSDGTEYSNRGRGGNHRPVRGSPKYAANNRGYHHSVSFDSYHGGTPASTSVAAPLSPTGVDGRTVIATDKSIRVMVNQGTGCTSKGPLMSVKVSPPSIAGTGRVGPRQKTRVMYSSQSEAEVAAHEHDVLPRQKSFEDKSRGVHFDRDVDAQQNIASKSPYPQKKRDGNPKNPYSQKREYNGKKEDAASPPPRQGKRSDHEPKSPYMRRKNTKDAPKSPYAQRRAVGFTDDAPKSPRASRRFSEKTRADASKSPNMPRKANDRNAVEKSEGAILPQPTEPPEKTTDSNDAKDTNEERKDEDFIETSKDETDAKPFRPEMGGSAEVIVATKVEEQANEAYKTDINVAENTKEHSNGTSKNDDTRNTTKDVEAAMDNSPVTKTADTAEDGNGKVDNDLDRAVEKLKNDTASDETERDEAKVVEEVNCPEKETSQGHDKVVLKEGRNGLLEIAQDEGVDEVDVSSDAILTAVTDGEKEASTNPDEVQGESIDKRTDTVEREIQEESESETITKETTVPEIEEKPLVENVETDTIAAILTNDGNKSACDQVESNNSSSNNEGMALKEVDVTISEIRKNN